MPTSTSLYAAGLTALLLLPATVVLAQQPSEPASRWHVGLAPVLEFRAFVVDHESHGSYLLGGTGYGAYSLTPNLTVQAGVFHGRGGTLDDNFADDGTPKYVPVSYKEQVWGVPLTLRYLLSKPERRFQVAGLLGVSVYHIQQTRTNNILRTDVSSGGWQPYVTKARAVNGYLNFGLDFRYAVSPRWSVVTDLTANMVMKQIGYYGIGPGASGALGLEYTFH
ncbi:hypothetical protein [Hymenobacter guriensis]|uniref:Outer membrane protein beta-barrel domain-containing protein n=1 Tax=Hymenobacter guriensis TaxID=2793065 RepID=A0ABS0L8B2_9BACT|nr:hypothetical protein [Hymenobacter guriensis]MBG8556390.1 hypothetical protein [Hymenobacter guriensis]